MDKETKLLTQVAVAKLIGGGTIGIFIGKACSAALKECASPTEKVLTYVGGMIVTAGLGYKLIDEPINKIWEAKLEELQIEEKKETEEKEEDEE